MYCFQGLNAALDGDGEIVGNVVVGVNSVHTETTAGERPPEGAGVLAVVVDLIGEDHGVTVVNEGGVAGAELEGVNHKLEDDVVSALAVVPVGVKAKGLGEVQEDVVDHGAPNAALGVNSGVLAAVNVGVGLGVDGHGVGVVIEADATAGGVLAHAEDGVLVVLGPPAEEDGEAVTVALTHAASLAGAHAVGVAGSTGETVANTVGVLVDDNAVVEVAVEHGADLVPEVHPHPGALTVGRGGEVGVVVAGAVLGVGLDGVVAETAVAEVVLLEVAGDLVKTVLVEDVVDDVVPVEEVGGSGINVLAGLLGEVDGEVKVQVEATAGAVVVLPGDAAVEVLLGVDVVAAGVSEGVAVALVVPAELGAGGGEVGVSDNLAVAVEGVVHGEGVDIVVGALEPVDDEGELARVGVDEGVPPVLLATDVDVPGELELTLLGLDVGEADGDLVKRKVTSGEDTLLLLGWKA